MLQVLYGNSCSIVDRERVIGPALAPILDEFISDCSKEAESGTVNFNNTLQFNILHYGSCATTNNYFSFFRTDMNSKRATKHISRILHLLH